MNEKKTMEKHRGPEIDEQRQIDEKSKDIKVSEVALRNITEKISSHLTGILQFTEQIEPSKKTIQHLKLGFTTDQQPDTR